MPARALPRLRPLVARNRIWPHCMKMIEWCLSLRVTVADNPRTNRAFDRQATASKRWGAPGQLPARGSHRSGRSELPHPVPWRRGSLLSGQSVHDSRWVQAGTGPGAVENPLPGPIPGVGASTQPFPPQAGPSDGGSNSATASCKSRRSSVVAPQLAIQLPVLVRHPPVSVPAAPLADSLQRVAEASLLRLAFDQTTSSSAFPIGG